MPFTPIHFGPGVLVKAVAPAQFSFTAFVLANVLIDLEPLFHIVMGDSPLHGPLHSLLGATATGVLAGVGLSLLSEASKRVPSIKDATSSLPIEFQAELRMLACVFGGAVGGTSHAYFDSLIYADFYPLVPFSLGNPMLGSIAPDVLVTGLLSAGLIGVALLTARVVVTRLNRRAG